MARTTIPPELVATNAIQGTLIADNAITAVHIATNAISGTLVADNAITSTHIAQNNVTATQIAQNTITVTQMADSAIETAKINNDAVTQAKIADDAVGPDQLAANAVVTGSIANGTIIEADMGDNAITLAKMASLARGKIIVGDSAGDPSALAIGSNGTVLSSDGTDVSWAAASGGVDGISSSANATAITITSGEEVGIGNASPQVKFVVGDGTNGTGLEVTPNESSGYVNMNAYDRGSSAWRTMNIGGDVVTLNTSGSERMRIDSSGNLQIKTSSAASSNSVSLPGYIEFKGQGWDSNSGSDDMNAKIEMAATYGKVGSGATSPELVFSLQGAGGLDSSSESYVEGMRLVGAGANNNNQPRLGIGTTAPGSVLDVTHSAGAHTPVLRLTGSSTSGYAAGLEWYSGYGPKVSSQMFSTASGSQGGEYWQEVRNQSTNTLKRTYHVSNAAKHTFYGQHNGDAVGHFLFTNSLHDGTSTNCSLVVQNGQTFIQIMGWSSLGARIGTRTGGWSGNSGGDVHFTRQDSMQIKLGSSGPVLSNGTAISSDERLKKNIANVADGQLAKINALTVRTFEWKNTDTQYAGTQEGFIAQEVESVIPEAVKEETMAPDPHDDTRDFEGDVKLLKHEVINARLVKAVQELSAKLEAAEARITAGGL